MATHAIISGSREGVRQHVSVVSADVHNTGHPGQRGPDPQSSGAALHKRQEPGVIPRLGLPDEGAAAPHAIHSCGMTLHCRPATPAPLEQWQFIMVAVAVRGSI